MRLCRVVLTLFVAGCAGAQPHSGSAPLAGSSVVPGPAKYLYVWAGDLDGDASDFVAVYDVRLGSPTYGQLLSTTPVGEHHTHPHHLEYELPGEGGLLFASGYRAEKLFLVDYQDPERLRIARTLSAAPGFRFPHDMTRLPNGNVLVSYLGTDNAPVDDGGLVEYSPSGDLLRSAHSADTAAHGQVRTYAMAVLPAMDRLVTTSAPMHQDSTADVLQIWELSSLKLLRTLRLPEGPAPHLKQLPFEPRVMADGRTVLLNTFGCGFYRVTGIDHPMPEVHYVSAIADRFADCGVPVVTDRYWVMPVGKLSRLVSFDISDPEHPVEVSRLEADTTFRPHWLARDPGSDRLIVGGENGGEERMLMARLDPATGRLSWDESLRSPDGSLGISFRREEWPHGRTGAAFAHAALFRR